MTYEMWDSHDDELMHYGKKGMKWGVRNERRKAAFDTLVKSKKSKIARAQEANKVRKEKRAEAVKEAYGPEKTARVKGARERQKERYKKLQEADDAYMLSTTKKGQAETLRQLKKAENEYLTHPDAKMARKMTAGERIVAETLFTGAAMYGIYKLTDRLM